VEVDFSKLDLATATKVDEVIRGTYNQTLLRAAERQRRVAFINHLHRPLAQDGFGERTLMIDPVFDAYWRACYGSRYTHDADLLKFLTKRNPEIAVRSRGTKEIFVGYAPGSASRRPCGLTETEKSGKRESGKAGNMAESGKRESGKAGNGEGGACAHG